MTTVLALGGCGGVGRHAVPTVLADPGVDRVVLADRDGARAEADAARYGSRVTPLALDVTDGPALRRAVEGAEVVMSTVGPYFRFAVPILQATIDVGGRTYLDVCDDWEPTLEMLALDAAAREREVRAVVGLGITPGVSNLMARVVIEELDEAHEAITGWDVDSARPDAIGPEPSAATLHGVEQLTGTIRLWRGGAYADERPIRATDIDYPGLGRRTAWTIGHPEPVTLPRRWPELRTCLNVMVTGRASILVLRAFRALVDRGLMSKRRAARLFELAEGAGGETPRLEQLLRRGWGRLPLPPMFALASGLRGGAEATVAAMLLTAPAGGMGGSTGVPLGVGVRRALAGAGPGPGVWAPEDAFEPAAFLDQLAPLCSPPAPSGSKLLLVSRSWEPRGLRAALVEAYTT